MPTTAKRFYAPDDVLKIWNRPKPDLVDGRLIERDSMGQEADTIIGTIIEILRRYSRITLKGLVNGPECGYQVFPGKPNRVRYPDASFTRLDRVPGGKPAKGHSMVVPDLVVEVISPNDRMGKFQSKLKDFQSVPIPLIWVVYAEQREVHIHKPDGTIVRLSEDKTLDGGVALPGLSVKVSQLFE